MTDDIQKDPIAAALRAVVEEKIATLDLAGLADYADRMYDAGPGSFEDDTPADTVLFRALRDAREHVADYRRTAGRIEEERKRRPGESEERSAMSNPVKIVGGVLQRDPTWTDAEYAERLRHHRERARLGSAHLLALAAADVVRSICRLPDDVDADASHVRHTILIADSIERMAERDGYWTTEAAQAIMDLKSARLRAAAAIEAGDD